MYSKVGLKIKIPYFPTTWKIKERGSELVGEERIFFKGMVEEMIGRGIPLKVWNKMIMLNQEVGQDYRHRGSSVSDLKDTFWDYWIDHPKFPRGTKTRFDEESKKQFYIWSKEETEEWKEVFWEEIIPTIFDRYEKYCRYELWDFTTNYRKLEDRNSFDYYHGSGFRSDYEIPSWSLDNREHMEKCWGKNYWKVKVQ